MCDYGYKFNVSVCNLCLCCSYMVVVIVEMKFLSDCIMFDFYLLILFGGIV